jgi:hypothetical protein
MATNNKRTGYSDALGGYGVPAQVKITGEASMPGESVKRAKPRKSKGLVFRPKPINIIIIIAIIAAVVVVTLIATNAFGSRYASSIDHVGSEIQPMNGADATVYRPILAEDVDWNNIEKSEREGIALYGVNYVLDETIGDNPAGIYTIIGMTYDNQPAFLYSPNTGTVQILVSGEPGYLIPLE